MQVNSAYATWNSTKNSTCNWDVSLQKSQLSKGQIISKINNRTLKL